MRKRKRELSPEKEFGEAFMRSLVYFERAKRSQRAKLAARRRKRN